MRTEGGGTLARTVTRAPQANGWALLPRNTMQGEEPTTSVLLHALAGAWRCEGVRILPVPADGLTVRAGDAPGLRLFWIEQSMCSVSWGHAREALAPPSSLVLLPRAGGLRLTPVGDGMARVLTAVWPTSAWCASLLLDEVPLVVQVGALHQPEALRALRPRLPAQRAADDPLSAECARALLACGLRAIESAPTQSILAGAFTHPRLGAWLRDTLSQTGPLPSIDDCARRCCLSRSAFTRNFATLTGMSYLEFLTRWRMNAALHRLVLGGADVDAVSALYGYESEVSFRKAFRRATGLAPGAARRAAGIDAALGNAAELPPDKAGAPAKPLLLGPVPRVSVTTHTQPPELASMLSAVISGL